MKKLPNISQRSIIKKINTNKEMCIVEESNKYSEDDITGILNDVYAGLGEYNTRVIIETENKTFDTTLIYKDSKKIITEDNTLIKIDDIKKIIIKQI